MTLKALLNLAQSFGGIADASKVYFFAKAEANAFLVAVAKVAPESLRDARRLCVLCA